MSETLGRKALLMMLPAIVFMLLGILVGLPRLVLLYSPGYSDGLVAPLHQRFYNIYDYHSSLILIGFIAVLISVERFAGVPRGLGHLRGVLLLSIVSYVSGVALLLVDRVFEARIDMAISSYPLLLGGMAMIYYYLSIRRYVPGPSLSLFIAAYASLIIAILNTVVFPILPYDYYSALYLAYPLLFILGERMELTPFLGGPGRLLRLASHISITIPLMQLLGRLHYISILTALLILLLRRDARLAGSPYVDRYLYRHLLLSYLWLGLSLATYAYLAATNNWFFTDLFIHLAALGFIGNMLLGHAPIVFKAVTGIDMGRSYIATLVLNLGILLRIVASLASYLAIDGITGVLAFMSGWRLVCRS